MRKALLFAMTAIVATGAFAQQIRSPRPSPKATLTQTVGITDITVNYSRPGVKGRTVFGGLVPYDKVWRTGANEATTISFSDDVTINGQKLPKGTYSLHTIPGASQWTVIFNSVADQWGSYSYDPAKDALRVTTTPKKGEFREWMTFEINDMTTDTATMNIRWADVVVPVTIDTGSTARTLASFRNAMKPNWQVPYQAANFAFETKAASNEEINAWLDQSLQLNQNIGNLWLKARILRAEGKTADAIRYAEQAIAKATPQQTDFANEIRRQSNEWRNQ